MELNIAQFLIVCPLVFLGGFVDAVAGGGGLISLPAYLIAGFPVTTAIGTNKLSSAMGTSLTTVRYARDGFIPWKMAGICAVFALIGSSLGAEIALLLDDGVFKIIMLVILPLTALYVSRGKALVEEKSAYPFGKAAVFASVIALIIGIYDGFYGPGTGTFLIILLTAVAHIPVTEANGTAKVINLSTNVAALVVYIINGKVIYLLGLTAGVFGILGNHLGVRYFEKGGAKSMKPIMITVLAIFFVKVLYEVISA
ncbi:MAG: TSUP family transporter [Bacillota bacterium]|nr:TSUP family transporter [Bacillota bacterium]